jgi:hypothetical protein
VSDSGSRRGAVRARRRCGEGQDEDSKRTKQPMNRPNKRRPEAAAMRDLGRIRLRHDCSVRVSGPSAMIQVHQDQWRKSGRVTLGRRGASRTAAEAIQRCSNCQRRDSLGARLRVR